MNFDSVACDWLTFRHRYRTPREAREAGRVMKVSAAGEIEWESASWEAIRCPSSDTSIRVKCDGQYIYGSANIGRFQRPDNLHGLTVLECVERWAEVLRVLGFDLEGFGTRWAEGTPGEWGTVLTRIDLAGNFETDDFAALCHSMSVRRIGKKLPMVGKYGPTWGYDSKRSNWWKAKIYDKSAELAGKRRSAGGATLARFEVQLGGEYLKQNGLDKVSSWKEDVMGSVIYGRFAEQAFREQMSVEDWSAIPSRLRHYAVLWRDGVDIRTQCAESTFYRVQSKLKEFGIDIGTPCNVMALVRRSRVVHVAPVAALLRDVA